MDAILDTAVNQLTSDDRRLRAQAARTLPLLASDVAMGECGPLRSGSIVAALAAAACDSDCEARLAVVEALGALDSWGEQASRIEAALNERLRDINATVRRAAVAAFAGRATIDAATWRALIAAVNDIDDTVRLPAIELVADVPHELRPSAYAMVLQMTSDAQPGVRAAALDTLDRLDHEAEQTVQSLRQAIHDGDAGVRQTAVRLLSAHRGDMPSVVGVFESALGDADATVRRLAAVGLGDLGVEAQKAAVALAERLDDADAAVRQAVVAAIEQTACHARPWLREALQLHIMLRAAGRLDRRTDTQAMRTLLSADAAQAAAWFAPLLDDADEQIRWYAALGLGESAATPVSMKPQLLRMLRDGDAATKVAALVGLMGLGPHGRDAVDDIQRYVNDGNYIVAQLATAAIGVLRRA